MPATGDAPSERIDLTGTHLRKATFAANRLRRDFARALPRIVGDAAAWRASLDTVLTLLKAHVHDGAALPANLFADPRLYARGVHSRADGLATTHAALAPTIRALSWLLATTPKLAPKYLRFCERNGDAMARAVKERPSGDTAIAVVQLAHLAAQHGERVVAPLVGLLGNPAIHRASLRGAGFATATATALGGTAPNADRIPTSPPRTLATHVYGWLAWLIGQDPATRRRFTRLLTICGIEPLIGDWCAWWQTSDAYVDKARTVARQRLAAAEVGKRYGALLSGYEAHRLSLPPDVDVAQLGRALQAAASLGHALPAPALSRALRALPNERSALRAAALIHWSLIATAAEPQERNGMAALLARLATYLSRTHAESRALSPWRDAWLRNAASPRSDWGTEGTFITTSAPVMRRAMAALEALVAGDPALVGQHAANRAAHIAQVVRSPARIADIIARNRRADPPVDYVSHDVLRAALASCGDDLGLLPALERTFIYIDDETNLGAKGMRAALVPLFRHHRDLVNSILVGPQSADVLRCARKLAAVVALGRRPPRPRAPHASTFWIRHYPAELRPSLRKLASVTDDARAIADKLLRSAWRPAPDLRSERDALRDRVATATSDARTRLEVRLAALDQRISQPKPLSSAKLAKLAAKVSARAGLALLHDLAERADAVLAAAATELLGADEAPDWVTSDTVLPLFSAILELPKLSRELGLRVLRERCGPPPWDLRDAAQNATFVRRMTERGIDMRPWLDGIEPVVASTGRGPVTMAFESDPLEALHMGGHFQTCLSPGAFNFFSAVTNVADINKRVLYGRTAAGNVVARRLMCLTGDGALVVFNPYCHDSDFDFDEASAAIARDLARVMKTQTASHGEVPTLVAADWYDDGPEDITGAHTLLVDGSSFRAALADAAPTDVSKLVERETGERRLDRYMAPLVVALPEIEARPALAIPVLGAIGNLDELDTASVYLLAVRIIAADAPALARERLAPLLHRRIARAVRTDGNYAWQHVAMLCELDASLGLRALRATRPHGVRRWSDETQAWRLLHIGSCLERLARPVQALRAYRRCATAQGAKADRVEAAARADAMSGRRGRGAR